MKNFNERARICRLPNIFIHNLTSLWINKKFLIANQSFSVTKLLPLILPSFQRRISFRLFQNTENVIGNGIIYRYRDHRSYSRCNDILRGHLPNLLYQDSRCVVTSVGIVVQVFMPEKISTSPIFNTVKPINLSKLSNYIENISRTLRLINTGIYKKYIYIYLTPISRN